MFRRLSAWHMLIASLVCLSAAGCGNGRRGDATSHGKTGAAQAMPPSGSRQEPQLTSVVPSPAPATPTTATPPKAIEPEVAAPPVKSQEEILDQMVFEAERKPSDVRLRVKLARALFQAGKIPEARVHAERAIEVDEKSAGAWSVLGRIEMAERDFSAAATSFRHAVAEDPDSSSSWNSLGYALIEQRNFEEAAAALEHATSGSRPTGYMWNNLGMAYEHLDRIREARAAYRQAAEAGSTKGQANLARLEGVTSLRPAEADEGDSVKSDEFHSVPTDGSEGSVGGATRSPQEEQPGC